MSSFMGMAFISNMNSLFAMYPARYKSLGMREHPSIDRYRDFQRPSELLQHQPLFLSSNSRSGPSHCLQRPDVALPAMLLPQDPPAATPFPDQLFLMEDDCQPCFHAGDLEPTTVLRDFDFFAELQQQLVDNSPYPNNLAPAVTRINARASMFDLSQMSAPEDPYSGYNYVHSPFDSISSSHSLAAYQEQALFSDPEPSPVLTNETPQSLHKQQTGDEEAAAAGKPYAKLIYEALLQAPKHRLKLRDIYEWFTRNTKKPQESGTKGWQNSIRHNLSMNQAFENDKTECQSSSHSRRTDSVWVLSEHAIRHGVQSTTRYRKPCASKRGAVVGSPAIQRQRSGAKGGRATRKRALRLRKQESPESQEEAYISSGLMPYFRPSGSDDEESTMKQRSKQGPSLATSLMGDVSEELYAIPGNAVQSYDQLFNPCASPTFDEVNTVKAE